MTDNNTNEMRDAAVWLAQWFAIIQVKPKSKQPIHKNWPNTWTRDPAEIEKLWAKDPDANIGAVCTEGLTVIDIDDHGAVDGNETRRKWERENGDLPGTVTAITAGGGIHLIYRSDEAIRTVHASGDTGIDIQTGHDKSHFIVLPPSINDRGRRYAWEIAPDEMPIAPVDDQVLSFIEHVKRLKAKQHNTSARESAHGHHDGTMAANRFELPAVITEGGRNDTLFHFGCSLRAQCVNENDIAMYIRIANELRCSPPLPDDEVDHIIDSVLGYAPGIASN